MRTFINTYLSYMKVALITIVCATSIFFLSAGMRSLVLIYDLKVSDFLIPLSLAIVFIIVLTSINSRVDIRTRIYAKFKEKVKNLTKESLGQESWIPVHLKFSVTDARAARKALNLYPDKFTVFVYTGLVSGRNIPKILRELERGEIDVQAIILVGTNKELKAKVEAIASQSKFPILVIGYSENVEQLMSAANVVISELGDLKTLEAFSCHVPIIADVTMPLTPQEASAANLFVRRGAGVLLHAPGEIVPVIRRMLEN